MGNRIGLKYDKGLSKLALKNHQYFGGNPFENFEGFEMFEGVAGPTYTPPLFTGPTYGKGPFTLVGPDSNGNYTMNAPWGSYTGSITNIQYWAISPYYTGGGNNPVTGTPQPTVPAGGQMVNWTNSFENSFGSNAGLSKGVIQAALAKYNVAVDGNIQTLENIIDSGNAVAAVTAGQVNAAGQNFNKSVNQVAGDIGSVLNAALGGLGGTQQQAPPPIPVGPPPGLIIGFIVTAVGLVFLIMGLTEPKGKDRIPGEHKRPI